MNVFATMEVDFKDLYQMMIAECRYGYTRNNHLMPDCAYDRVKRLIPEMYKVDSEYALITVKQICEECITDQLTINFFDGEDDEFGNRKAAIEFINWCLEWIHDHEMTSRDTWVPYCFDMFLENCNKDTEPRYLVYKVLGSNKELITIEPVSELDYKDILFKDAPEGIYITYTREEHKVSDDPRDRRRSFTYHLLTPEEKDFYVEHI